MKNDFKTTHNLIFWSAPWDRDPTIQVFKIGTCKGQWIATDFTYDIISVINETPGNGHLEDVFEFFERSCRRDKRALRIREFFNEPFRQHCINKRGFVPVVGSSDLIKVF